MNGKMTFGEFAAALLVIRSSFSNAPDSPVMRAGRDVMNDLRDTVVNMHGKYQDGAGDYPDWKDLDDQTKARRARGGFTENEPLLASGELVRGWTIEETGNNELSLFNDKEYAAFHEEGISGRLPQRSTIGIALERDEKRLRKKFERRLWFYMKSRSGLNL